MRRWVRIAVVLLAATAFVTGVGGFTTGTADRGASVNVPTESSSAYLGVAPEDSIGSGVSPAVTITNNANQPLDIAAELKEDYRGVSITSPKGGTKEGLNPGESVDVKLNVDCSTFSSSSVTLVVDATDSDGSSFSVRSAEAEVGVNCPEESPTPTPTDTATPTPETVPVDTPGTPTPPVSPTVTP